MDDGYSGIQIAVFIGLVLLSAVLYGFGTAIQNVNEKELESQMEEGSSRAARLLRIVNRPTAFINTIQVFTSSATLIVGGGILGRAVWSGKGPVYMILEALSYIILLVSFGIVIPKRCAARKPEQWAYAARPLVSFLIMVLRPVTLLVTGICYIVLKIIGIDMFSKEDNVTEEDIMSMVNEGHEQGVLEAREAEMITNIFRLDDKKAEDVMSHRKNVVLLDGNMTLDQAIHFILLEDNHSRFPVYGEDMDDILGVIHLREMMTCAEKGIYGNMPIREVPGLMMEAHFIPESRSVDSLFREMQSQKIHMEIVVDEYGQLAGIVTMEDILEEIVGNILDEYDVDEDFIAAQEDGSFVLSGMAPLDEVSGVLGIEFDEEDEELYDTINGFLISKLGRIPDEGENPVVECLGYEFQILKVGNKMIQSVRVVRKETEEEREPEET